MYFGHVWFIFPGLLLLLVVPVAVVLVVVALVRHGHDPQPTIPFPAFPPPPSPAIHELDLRYARGEVSREDYLQRRADLLGQPGPSAGAPAPRG